MEKSQNWLVRVVKLDLGGVGRMNMMKLRNSPKVNKNVIFKSFT